MSVRTTEHDLYVVGEPDPDVAEPDVSEADVPDADVPEPWWEGVWFEGAWDPRGTIFAVTLAVGATAALVVLVTAAVRIVTGA